jgi:hypothetical protein
LSWNSPAISETFRNGREDHSEEMADEGANGALPGKPDSFAESGADSGWEGVSELLSGFRPDQVPFLAQARELEPTYPLLHALAHGSLRDFIIRVAALEALIVDGRTPFTPAEVVESLYWLKDPVRDSVLAALRRSGWLSYRPDSGYRVTDAGRFVATVLSFLRARVREGSVLPAVEGIDYMLNLGVDPTMQLKLLRSQLENLRTEMENARSSHSEVVPRGSAAESFLRASLLPLLGEAIGGEGVAGRIGALPLALCLEGDGFPAPAPKPLSALTPGTIGPPAEVTSDG